MVKTKGERMHAWTDQTVAENWRCWKYVLYIHLNIWWWPCLWFQQLHKCVARPVASSGDPVIHVSFGLSVTFATLSICDSISSFELVYVLIVHHHYFSCLLFPGAFYEPLLHSLHSVYGCTNYIWSKRRLLYAHDVRVGLASCVFPNDPHAHSDAIEMCIHQAFVTRSIA